MGRRIAMCRLFGRGSRLSDRLTRRGFFRRTAFVSTALVSSYLLASPAGAMIVPGGQTCVIGNTDGDGARLRADSSRNATILTTIPEGAIVLITNGPKDADGVTWYQVQYAGQSGWVDADYVVARKLSNYAAVTFTNGDGVRLRDNSDTNANVVGMVPEGAIVLIVNGPQFNGDGTPWYHVNHAGKHGYLMGTYLVPTNGSSPDTKPDKPADAPTPKAPDVKDGDRVKVTNTDNAGVRMRDDSGYSGDVLAILEEGTVVTVMGKPTVDTKGSGWVPSIKSTSRTPLCNSRHSATNRKPMSPRWRLATARRKSPKPRQQSPSVKQLLLMPN